MSSWESAFLEMLVPGWKDAANLENFREFESHSTKALISLWKEDALEKPPTAAPTTAVNKVVNLTAYVTWRLHSALCIIQTLSPADQQQLLQELPCFTDSELVHALAAAVAWVQQVPRLAAEAASSSSSGAEWKELLIAWAAGLTVLRLLLTTPLKRGTDKGILVMMLKQISTTGVLTDTLPEVVCRIVAKLAAARQSCVNFPLTAAFELLSAVQDASSLVGSTYTQGLPVSLAHAVQQCIAMLPDAAAEDSNDYSSSIDRAGTSSSNSSGRSSNAAGATGSSSGDISSSTCNSGQEASTASSKSSQNTVRSACVLVSLQYKLLVQQCNKATAADHNSPVLSRSWLLKSETGDACLQLLYPFVTQLHNQLVAAVPKQQQQQQQVAQSVQLPCPGKIMVSGRKRPICASHLPIPATHQRLKLLPAAACSSYMAAFSALTGARKLLPSGTLQQAATALQIHVQALHAAAMDTARLIQNYECTFAALKPPAVLLMIELLLLLASELERRMAGNTGQTSEFVARIAAPVIRKVIIQCSGILQLLLRTLAAGDVPGYSVRRQVVLRQSGHQLLQWCIRQVQVIASNEWPLDIAAAAARSRAVQLQLQMIWNLCKDTTADAGEGCVQKKAAPLLSQLAMAHPQELFLLLDTAVRGGLGPAGLLHTAEALDSIWYPLRQDMPGGMHRWLHQPSAGTALAAYINSTVCAVSSHIYGSQPTAKTPAGLTAAQQEQLLVKAVPYLIQLLLQPLAAAVAIFIAPVVSKHLSMGISNGYGTISADNDAGSSGSSTDSASSSGNAGGSSGRAAQSAADSNCCSGGAICHQCFASGVLLLVHAARALVVLTDAADSAAAAAGTTPQQLFAQAMCSDTPFWNGEDGHVSVPDVGCTKTVPCQGHRTVAAEVDAGVAACYWMQWQAVVHEVGKTVMSALQNLVTNSTVIKAVAAAAAGTYKAPQASICPGIPNRDSCRQEAAPAAQQMHSNSNSDDGNGSSSTNGSSSSCTTVERVQWPYLLQLWRSMRLTAALSEESERAIVRIGFSSVPPVAEEDVLHQAAAATVMPQNNKAYQHVLQFCRVLAESAPLPHICNNLSCSASGLHVTGTPVKVCGGCGAWYCSVECAKAHWPQHKRACKRMAALGLNVNA